MRQSFMSASFQQGPITPTTLVQFCIESLAAPGLLMLVPLGGAVTEVRVSLDGVQIASYAPLNTTQTLEVPHGVLLIVHSVGPAGPNLNARISGLVYQSHRRVLAAV